jgi:hypothetical protein
MKSHSPATPCRSGEYADVAARTLRVGSDLQRTAASVLVVAGLVFSGSPACQSEQGL